MKFNQIFCLLVYSSSVVAGDITNALDPIRDGNLAHPDTRECIRFLGLVGFQNIGELPTNFLWLKPNSRHRPNRQQEFPNRYVLKEDGPFRTLSLSFDAQAGSLELDIESHFRPLNAQDQNLQIEFRAGRIREDIAGTKIYAAKSTNGHYRIRLVYAENSVRIGTVLEIWLDQKIGFFKWQQVIKLFSDDIQLISPSSFFGGLFIDNPPALPEDLWQKLKSGGLSTRETRNQLNEWDRIYKTAKALVSERVRSILNDLRNNRASSFIDYDVSASEHMKIVGIAFKFLLQDKANNNWEELENLVDLLIHDRIHIINDLYSLNAR